MKQVIDLKQPVGILLKEHDDLEAILKEVDIHLPPVPEMLNVVKISDIAAKKNIPLGHIIRKLRKHGYEVEGNEMLSFADPNVAKDRDERKKNLKEMLQKLNEGIPLDVVRQEFTRAFSHVEAAEIMAAEQELIQEGTPIEEMQRLCDLHSALFHDNTKQHIVNKDEVEEQKEQLYATCGHPLALLKKENDALACLIKKLQQALANGEAVDALLAEIGGISSHYSKKGDLIYPFIATKYGVTGPSKVMWTVDDDIRRDFRILMRREDRTQPWKEALLALLTKMEEMIYKEENILFPICVRLLTEEDWYQIYRDGKEYEVAFQVPQEPWQEAEAYLATSVASTSLSDGVISMPGGNLTITQLIAILNTLPVEITVVDANDHNQFFNEGPKDFKRPFAALGRDVYSCHPPKIEAMVRMIISEFKEGKRDKLERWAEKNGKLFFVTYFAIRDSKGTYLGTLETVQDMQFAKDYFLKD